ncbi:MAG: response regulator, partial [Deltaproteobacteria bacterium]
MENEPIRLLIIDDDPGVLRAMQTLFKRGGHQVIALSDPAEAVGSLTEEAPDVVLTDIRMPHLSGMDILGLVKSRRPEAEVILMTAFGSVQLAVEAVKKGAYDFLLKPFDDVSVVELAVQRAAERKRLRERTRALEAQLEVRE